MSIIKSCKDALEQSYTAYKKDLAALRRTVEKSKDNVNSRILTTKLASLEESINRLGASHTSWVSKAGFEPADLAVEAFSNQWLEGIWEEADELCDQAREILHLSEELNKPKTLNLDQQLVIASKQMDSLQANIMDEIEVLLSNTDVEAISSPTHVIYTEMMNNVAVQLDAPYNELSRAILNLSLSDTETVISEHESFRQNQQKRLVVVKVRLAQLAKDASELTPPPASCSRTHSTRSVEMEKCKAPTFTGRTIDYPEFKRGWCKVAAVAWDDGNQLEQMKQKVDPYTKKIISRCKDMNDVWDALDKEYGQEQEVVNAVNLELKQLRSEACTTPEYIVKLSNYLPRLEEALEAVDGLEHRIK